MSVDSMFELLGVLVISLIVLTIGVVLLAKGLRSLSTEDKNELSCGVGASMIIIGFWLLWVKFLTPLSLGY